MELKEQKFGIEIELTGISREKAAEVAADYLGTGTVYHRNLYDKYYAMDHSGREWSFVRDRSISQQKHVRGKIIDVSDDVRDSLKTEMVTPICGYEDIERIQGLVRQLRDNGAIANNSCGIHVHVDASPFDARTLRNLTNIMAAKEDLIFRRRYVTTGRNNGTNTEPERMKRIWQYLWLQLPQKPQLRRYQANRAEQRSQQW